MNIPFGALPIFDVDKGKCNICESPLNWIRAQLFLCPEHKQQLFDRMDGRNNPPVWPDEIDRDARM